MSYNNPTPTNPHGLHGHLSTPIRGHMVHMSVTELDDPCPECGTVFDSWSKHLAAHHKGVRKGYNVFECDECHTFYAVERAS